MRFALLCLAFAAAALGQEASPFGNPSFVLPPKVTLQTGLVYSSVGGQDVHLDLFQPSPPHQPAPAIVFIHGGSWHDTAPLRKQFYRQAAAMAEIGFVGACIEYRDSRQAPYPAAWDDTRAAVRWIRAHATEYQVDPDRILAAGGSAGGNLAELLGTRADASSHVAAVAAFNPVSDLIAIRDGNQKNPLLTYLKVPYEQNPGLWREASPLYWTNRKSVPLLIMHGDADTTVPYAQSVEMIRRLKAAGVQAELFTVPGANHGFFNASPWYDATLARMKAFFAPWAAPGAPGVAR